MRAPGSFDTHDGAPIVARFTATSTPRPRFAAIAGTPDGKGYWRAQVDGGVSAFGDANYLGSNNVGTP